MNTPSLGEHEQRGKLPGHAGMPRVLVDGYFFDRPYGFGRYVRELVHALDSWATDFKPVLLVPEAIAGQASKFTKNTEIVTSPNRFFPFWEQVIVPRVAHSRSCALVHFPYQSTALAWPRRRTVTTIHDLMFLRVDATSGALMDRLAHVYRRWLFQLHTRHARRILAVSEATQGELHERFGEASVVVGNVCDAFVSAQRETAPANEGSYFLHRGDAGPHKNTRRVISAFAEVRRVAPQARLLIYGPAVGPELVEGLPSEGVRVVGRVTDTELASLYKGAVAVVAPSIEEGFGLSIVEAMGFGTAIITSNLSPMRDVAGPAGLLVDPLQEDAISRAMLRVLQDESVREELLAEGRKRYENFSAKQLARSLQQVYQQALDD